MESSGADMNDPDPAQVASLEELAECLRQLRVRADRPSLRELEDRTKHANELLPGTQFKQVRLGRTNLSDVLRGTQFPKKAFLLTLVDALHVDLGADRRWEQAWDRLAPRYLDRAPETESGQLRQELAEAKARADRADQKIEQLHRQLAAAGELVRQQTVAAATVETRVQEGLIQAINARAFPVSLSFEEAIDGLTVTLPEITLEIPPTITDRQAFFYAFAEVRPHPVFGRDGENLTVTVPVTRSELEQGSVIKVPAFRRPPVNLRIHPGTPSGRRFRIPDLGVRGPGNRNSFLIITVDEVHDAAKTDEMRAELCIRARGDAVTVDPVRGSLPRPGDGKGATERELSSRDFEIVHEHALHQARIRAEELRTARVIRLIVHAGDIAQSITDESQKVRALAAAAKVVAAADPSRAHQLIDAAEDIAQTITDAYSKTLALTGIAEAVAADDPRRANRLIDAAEDIAQTITDESQKADALAHAAAAMTAADLNRAYRLIDAAEDIAQTMRNNSQRACALVLIAKETAVISPSRARQLIDAAERIAHDITDAYSKTLALTGIAEAVAADDPRRANRLIDAAEDIAQTITDESQKAHALANAAAAMTAPYPGKAERIAQTITDEYSKACALVLIAKEMAVINPSRARQLIDAAERIAQTITDESQKSAIRSRIAEAVAATDPDRAERIAHDITDAYSKTLALTGIAEAVAAAPHPDRVP